MSVIRKRKDGFQLDFMLLGDRIRKSFKCLEDAQKYKDFVDGEGGNQSAIKEFQRYDFDPPKEMLEIKKFNLRCYLQKIVNVENAIYFLYKNKKLIYIGMTKNLLHRLFASEHRLKFFDEAYFIEFKKEDDISTLETLLIAKYNPPLNKIGRSEHLHGMEFVDDADLRIQYEFLKLYDLENIEPSGQLDGSRMIKMIPDDLPEEVKISIHNGR